MRPLFSPSPSILAFHSMRCTYWRRISRELRRRMGDADEARNLVQTAAAAVALVQLLYQRKPRVLADVAKDRMDFPIMGSFAKGPMRSQMEMLKKLGLGDRSPIRTTGIKQDLFYDAVFALLKPLFDAIRWSMLIPSQINPEEYSDFPPAVLGVLPKIKALPELDPNSKESARRWIEALVDYWFAALPAGTHRQSGMLGQAMKSPAKPWSAGRGRRAADSL